MCYKDLYFDISLSQIKGRALALVDLILIKESLQTESSAYFFYIYVSPIWLAAYFTAIQ